MSLGLTILTTFSVVTILTALTIFTIPILSCRPVATPCFYIGHW
jgi:hypothetical protein